MLIENSSDLIAAVEPITLANGRGADVAQLINGSVLLIAEDALALYRSRAQVGDALGNGLIRSVGLPLPLVAENGRFLLEHRAGYVGLCGGLVLLITLNDVQMFRSREDALHNRGELVRLPLGE